MSPAWRRLLGLLAALALSAPLAAASSTAPIAAAPARADAGASDCAWHRHSKRVVKKVRKNGRVRRVVRVVRWWTCDPLPPSRLGVQAFEFYFVLSRPAVSAGDLAVELHNRGEDAHNLKLQLAAGLGPVLEVGEAESLARSERRLRVDPGLYRLWCSLPLHAESGMETTLVVTPG